jgi:hypothetical protein
MGGDFRIVIILADELNDLISARRPTDESRLRFGGMSDPEDSSNEEQAAPSSRPHDSASSLIQISPHTERQDSLSVFRLDVED